MRSIHIMSRSYYFIFCLTVRMLVYYVSSIYLPITNLIKLLSTNRISYHVSSFNIFWVIVGCAANSLDLICYILHSIEAPLNYLPIILLYCCVKLSFIYSIYLLIVELTLELNDLFPEATSNS